MVYLKIMGRRADDTKALIGRSSHRVSSPPRLLVLFLMLLLFAALCSYLDAYLGEYDEGPTLQAAALNGEGHRLYEDIVYNKPPLLVWWLRLGMHMGGTSLPVGRLTIAWINFLGFCALTALSIRWFGPWAGAVALLTVLGTPDLVARMVSATNELPALAMACLSLLAVTRFRETRRRLSALLAGLAFGMALAFHPMVVYAAAPIGLLIALPQGQPATLRRWLNNILTPGLTFAASTLAVTVLWLAICSSGSFAKWVIAYNSAPLDTKLADLTANNHIALASYYFGSKLHLSVAFACACVALLSSRKFRGIGIVAMVWFSATIVTLTALRPMWWHYTVLGLYPMIVGISGAVSVVMESAASYLPPTTQYSQSRLAYASIATLGFAAMAVALTLGLPNRSEWPASRMALVEFISQETANSETVVVDDPLAAFMAGRRVPPSLADSSKKRIATGYLERADVIAAMLKSSARFLIFATHRLSGLYSLLEWAMTETELYAETPDYLAFEFKPPHDIDVPLSVELGDWIQLKGFTLDEGPLLTLTLYWQAVQPPDYDYHIFVHLTDEHGNLAAQADSPPMNGTLPTTAWPLETLIPHTVTLVVGDLDRGDYTLSAGMYRYPELVRLPVTSIDGARTVDNSVVLTTVEIR